MKKFLLIVFSLFVFATIQSQEVNFGAKIGLNVSKVGGDTDMGDFGLKSGFHIGGLAEISFSEKFALQPELLYSFEVYEFGSILQSVDVKSSYIRVPILAKYYIIERLSAEAGPSFGALVSAKVKDVDVKDDFNSFDAAIALGASYHLDMGVFFSLRYNLGLTNMNDVEGFNVKNQANTFQVSAGYFF